VKLEGGERKGHVSDQNLRAFPQRADLLLMERRQTKEEKERRKGGHRNEGGKKTK